MMGLINLDLLTVGITVASIATLGFILYINNRSSVTHRSFLLLAISSMVWSIANYLSYQIKIEIFALLLVRIVMFSAVWFAFYLFKLLYVFPSETKEFLNKTLRRFLYLWVICISILTLTPYLFSDFSGPLTNNPPQPVAEGGIIFFGITIFVFLAGGIFILIKKTVTATHSDKKPFILVLIGTILTFLLILIFNFILPVLFNNVRFVPLGAIFIFPFVAFTTYAIYRHKLFNIKNLTSAILAFLLCLITFIEIILADNMSLIAFRAIVFILVFMISIQFIKNIFNLEAANEQKSEFMSFAAHEIRTPLTAVKGYASLILEGDLGEINPQVKDAVQKIMISSNKVIVLISQYLNKSKIELSRLFYSFTIFDLGKLVKEVAQNFQVNAEQKGIILAVDIEAGAAYNIKADEGKIGEVIGNIIDNAIKYTNKGSVAVSVAKRNGKVTVKISDTGAGIPKETMPKLFKKFSRAETEKANFLGTGLGLFLAKTFIDAHKGRVWAESKGKGQGSQFYVELPKI